MRGYLAAGQGKVTNETSRKNNGNLRLGSCWGRGWITVSRTHNRNSPSDHAFCRPNPRDRWEPFPEAAIKPAKDWRIGGDMSDYVEKLKQEAAQLRVVRACGTCRHRIGPKSVPSIWRCGAVGGHYANDTRNHGDMCGKNGLMWEPIPHSFWKRLGDALIERIRGRHHE